MTEMAKAPGFSLPQNITEALHVLQEAESLVTASREVVYDCFGLELVALAKRLGVTESSGVASFTAEHDFQISAKLGKIYINFKKGNEHSPTHHLVISEGGRILKQSFNDEDSHGEWFPSGEQAIGYLREILEGITRFTNQLS